MIMNGIRNLVNLQMDEDSDDDVRTYMSRFDAMLLEINTNDLTVDSIFTLMFFSGLSSRFHSLVAGYGRRGKLPSKKFFKLNLGGAVIFAAHAAVTTMDYSNTWILDSGTNV
ncbi:hypothetical protein H4S02_004002 [Coemansia sp. RSA 2611]|nr:hypothetical protein H4S02_004002 [Coemansia sp. RSA 2611]